MFQLSLCKNQLLRMYGVCRLHNLQELHLAYNGILTIEGLKELQHLSHLNLEGNNIKAIEHLNTNIKLEYLNLSENSIGIISDISYLKCLKVRIDWFASFRFIPTLDPMHSFTFFLNRKHF